MKELAGKVAVITGGGSGIGRGMARAFAEHGVRVAVADIEIEPATEVAKEVGGQPFVVDVADLESVLSMAAKVYDHFGAVDILCNNAGVAVPGPLEQMTVEDWRWLLSVNVEGLAHGLSVFLPRMLQQGGEAHIVNTGSIAGLVGFPGIGLYAATKAAVVTISEVLRAELADRGIGVTVICPGSVRTRILEADRNRPESLAKTNSVRRTELSAPQDDAIDPDVLGRQVCQAVIENRPYVLTLASANAPMGDALRARFQEITNLLNEAM